MKHRLSEVNEIDRTGICSVCGFTDIKIRSLKINTITARYRCAYVQRRKKSPYIVHKKDYCQHCGFKPVHPSQLDVDHIDANRDNNDPSNLQTLCANCHRLKTYLNDDSNSGKF